jgi:hypothetical protein
MSTLNKTKLYIKNATATNLSAAQINGACIATNDDIIAGTSKSKVITPYSAKIALNIMTNLGKDLGSSINANFTDIKLKSLKGNVIATNSESVDSTVTNKIITPSTLVNVLNNPPKIGATTPNTGNFDTVKLTSITGTAIATTSDLATGTNTSKVLTPLKVYEALKTPPAIGSGIPNTGNFNNVTVTGSLNAKNTVFSVSQGGTNTTQYGRGDLLVASGSTTLNKVNPGSDFQLLQADSTQATGVKWVDPTGFTDSIKAATNTEAVDTSVTDKALVPSNIPTVFASPGTTIGSTSVPNATFTTTEITGTLTMNNPIGPGSGGTGITTYSKGDILVAQNSSTLVKLPAGSGKYLQADSSQTAGVKWTALAALDQAVGGYPNNYLDIGVPTKVINSSYSIPHTYTKDSSNVYDIYIAGSTVVDPYSFNAGNDTYTGQQITGTVLTFGKHVYGIGTTFTNLSVGNYINIRGVNAKIINIISNTELIVDTIFNTLNGASALRYRTLGCQISTAMCRFGSSSLLVNTSSNVLSLANVLNNDTPKFTIEFWYNITAIPASTTIDLVSINVNNATYSASYRFSYSNGSYSINLVTSAGDNYQVGTFKINTWQHYALVYDQNGLVLFIDGIKLYDFSGYRHAGLGLLLENSIMLFNSAASVVYYVDELRISNNIRYTESFLPKDSAFVIDPNTILLHHFESTDGDTNIIPLESVMNQSTTYTNPIYSNFSGNAKISTTQFKFGSSSLSGASVTTDYMIYRNSIICPQYFTLEFWVYPNNFTSGWTLMQSNDSSFTISVSTSGIVTANSTSPGTLSTATNALTASTWNHVALTYNGVNYYLFINGTRQTSTLANNTHLPANALANLTIGKFNGYLDEFRISNTVRYSGSSFVVPSSAFTVDSNTIALCHFENTNNATSISDSTTISSYPFTMYKSFNMSSARLHLYIYTLNTTTKYILSNINYNNGDDFATNTGISTFAQLPMIMDLTSSGAPGIDGLQDVRFSVENNGNLSNDDGTNLTISDLKVYDSNLNYVYVNDSFNINSIDYSETNYYQTCILKGTINVSGTSITGSSTTFSTDFSVGDTIVIVNTQESGTITAIGSNTSITVNNSLSSTSGSYYYKRTTTNPASNITTNTSLTGTVNIVGNTIYGTGTSFTSQVSIGDTISVNGASVGSKVMNVVSDTVLKLKDTITNISKNVTWTAVGTPSIVTSNKKFGNSSLFLGTSNTLNAYYVSYPGVPSDLYEYTLECWFYPVNSNLTTLIAYNNRIRAANSTTSASLNIGFNAQKQTTFTLVNLPTSTSSSNVTLSGTGLTAYTLNSWNHIAYTYNGLNHCIYLNGNLEISIISGSRPYYESFREIVLGYLSTATTSAQRFSGYIDEFRFSSISRYNSNFTPSNAAFISDPNTLILKHFDVNNDTTVYSNSLALWLDASNTGSVTTSSGNVTQVNDLSGNGRNAVVSSAGGTSPVYNTTINGKNVITIAQNGKLLQSTGIGSISSVGYTAFYVTNITSFAANMIFYITTGSWGSTSAGFMMASSGNKLQYTFGGGGQVQSNDPVTTGTTYILTVVDTYTYSYLYVNGVYMGEAALTGTARSFASLDIGGYAADTTRTSPSKLAEFRLYTGNMSAYDRQSIEYALGTKWGVSVADPGSTPVNATYDIADTPYILTNKSINKITFNDYRYLLTGSLRVSGNFITGYDSAFKSELDIGDTIYFPRLNTSAMVTNVLSDTSLTVNNNLTPKTNPIQWKLNGECYLSSSQKRFGNTSLYFPVSSSYTTGESYAELDMLPLGLMDNTGTHTVEFWFNPSTLNNTRTGLTTLLAYRYVDSNMSPAAPTITYNNANFKVSLLAASLGTTDKANITVVPGTWNHVALVKSVSSTATTMMASLFVNGIWASYITGTNLGNTMLAGLVIGNTMNGTTANSPFYGYIDELRISNYARYGNNTVANSTNANLTYMIPTDIFSWDSTTLLLTHFEGPHKSTNLNYSTESEADYSISDILAYYSKGPLQNANAITTKTGNIIINGSNVVGKNTTFTADYKTGDTIIVANKKYKVKSIINDSQMTIYNDQLLPINTLYGTASISNTQAKFGSNSLSCNSNSSYLTITNFGDGALNAAYTIECWTYPQTFSYHNTIAHIVKKLYFGNILVRFNSLGNVVVIVYDSVNSVILTSSNTLTLNSWNHVALVYDNIGTYTIYVNGTGTSASSTVKISSNSPAMLTVGLSSYTNIYTPLDFGAYTLCTNKKFGTYGLSLYGNQYICQMTSALTNAPSVWTIEYFIYRNALTGASQVTHFNMPGYIHIFGDVSLCINTASGNVVNNLFSRSTAAAYAHYALTYNASGVYTFYYNGGSISTSAASQPNIPSSAWATFVIGTYNGVSAVIDELRISNSVRYTANFTPPSSAFTSDANTLLLQHFESSNINNSDDINTLTANSTANYFDELRISNIARYNSNFTPSSSAFTIDSQTSLLYHFDDLVNNQSTITDQSNYFINAGGSISSAQSAYSTNSLLISNNASTLNYVLVPAVNEPANSWTIEFWFWSAGGVVQELLSGKQIDYCGINVQTAATNAIACVFYTGNDATGTINAVTTPTFVVSSWNHLAIQYDGIKTYTVYLNGAVGVVAANAGLVRLHSSMWSTMILGKNIPGQSSALVYFNGFRISDTARYSAIFSPQSIPFISDSNTLLLNNFDSSTCLQTGLTYIPSDSNIIVSNSNYKFGYGSLFFPFSTTNVSYLQIPTIANQTGAWTIEFWAHCLGKTANASTLICGKDGANGTTYAGLLLQMSTTYGLTLSIGGAGSATNIANAVAGVTITPNVWIHYALVFTGSQYVLYVNGRQSNSITSAVAMNSTTWNLLKLGDPNTTKRSFYGYFDEFRVSNIARYTTEFKPQTSQFTSDANTLALNHFDYNVDSRTFETFNPTVSNPLTITDSTNVNKAIPLISNHARQSPTKNCHLYTYVQVTSNANTTLGNIVLSTKNANLLETPGLSNIKQIPYILTVGPDKTLIPVVYYNKKVIFKDKPQILITIPNTVTWYEVDLTHFVPTSINNVECTINSLSDNYETIVVSRDNTGSRSKTIVSGAYKTGNTAIIPINNSKFYVNNSNYSMKLQVSLHSYLLN